MASPIQGNNLTLWKQDAVLGMIPFAGARSCTLKVDLGLKETTNYASANWQEFKEDLMSWSITNEGLVVDSGYPYILLLRDQKTRTKYFFQFIVDEGSAGFYVLSGYCYITNISITGPQKDVAVVNATLQGTGAYTVSSTPISITGPGYTSTNILTFTTSYSATADGLTSFTVPSLVGAAVCLYASRGGIDVGNILTSGTPTGNDIVVNLTTGLVTLSTTNPTINGEFFRFLYR